MQEKKGRKEAIHWMNGMISSGHSILDVCIVISERNYQKITLFHFLKGGQIIFITYNLCAILVIPRNGQISIYENPELLEKTAC